MNLGATIHVNKFRFIVAAFAILLLIYFLTNRNTIDANADVSLRGLLEAAILAAENGGKRVLELKENPRISVKGKTKEGLDDRVTPADYKSHCAMMWTLKKNFRDVFVLSEESGHKHCEDFDDLEFNIEYHQVKGIDDAYAKLGEIIVWIDPLDATQEYTEKLFQYVTTMVCVSVAGKPVIGVIHNPFTKETSWAWIGYDVSPNLKDIKRPLINIGKKLKIITSRSHAGDVNERLRKIYQNNMEIIVAGGAGYKALQVANGAADAYVHMTAIKKWDVCAGNAILYALGGSLTTLKNESIDYADVFNVISGGIVATLRNHDKLIEKLKPYV